MSQRTLYKAQDGMCPWCSLPLPADFTGTEIDHIIPRCRGGPHESWNMQLLHRDCNRGTGGKRRVLTDEARALADKHGVILRDPPRPVGWTRAMRRGEPYIRSTLEQERTEEK